MQTPRNSSLVILLRTRELDGFSEFLFPVSAAQ